jgi:hypothetical protein
MNVHKRLTKIIIIIQIKYVFFLKIHLKFCHVKVDARWLSHHRPISVLPSTLGSPGKLRVTGSELGKGRPGNPLHG